MFKQQSLRHAVLEPFYTILARNRPGTTDRNLYYYKGGPLDPLRNDTLYYIFAIDVNAIALLLGMTPEDLRRLLLDNFLIPLFPRAIVYEELGIPVVDGTLTTPPTPGTIDRWLLFYTYFSTGNPFMPLRKLQLLTYEFEVTCSVMTIAHFLIPSSFYRHAISTSTDMLRFSLHTSLTYIVGYTETLWTILDVIEDITRLGRNALRDTIEVLVAPDGSDNPSYLVNKTILDPVGFYLLVGHMIKQFCYEGYSVLVGFPLRTTLSNYWYDDPDRRNAVLSNIDAYILFQRNYKSDGSVITARPHNTRKVLTISELKKGKWLL